MSADERTNVLSILAEVARRHPDLPALVMEEKDGRERTISFAGLRERSDRASAGLRRRGLMPSDRAIVMIPMSIELYVAMLALLDLGAVAVFVDPWVGWRQIAAFAAFAEPAAWLGIPRSHILRLLDRRLRRIPLTVTTGRRIGPAPARATLAELEESSGDGALWPVSPEDPALITFTTGSSGEPKGANRTHGFLLAQHRALAAEFPCREDDVDMPMFPVFALNNLATGVPSIVPAMDFRHVDQVDAARVLRQMERHKVTTCTASPPFFDRIAAELERRPEARPALRRVLTGGAPVSDAQLRAWRRALPDTEILVAYGSTEAEPVAHISAEERLALTGPGFCAGRPVDRVRTRVVWEGLDVPPGEIGELLVTGDHVCKDYYRNPRAVRENKVVDADGEVWHRMGDTGSFDGEGRFWIAGRIHSTIRRKGQLVHPQLLEQAARGDDPRLKKLAAVGMPDPELGERVVLVLEAPEDGVEEIERGIRERITGAGFPLDEIRFSKEPLPVDPRHNSKIDYSKLRESLKNF